MMDKMILNYNKYTNWKTKFFYLVAILCFVGQYNNNYYFITQSATCRLDGDITAVMCYMYVRQSCWNKILKNITQIRGNSNKTKNHEPFINNSSQGWPIKFWAIFPNQSCI